MPPAVAEPSRGPRALLGLVLLAPRPTCLCLSGRLPAPAAPALQGTALQSGSGRALWALLSTSRPGPLLASAPGLSRGPWRWVWPLASPWGLPRRSAEQGAHRTSPRSERLGERVREQRCLPARGFWEAGLSSQPRKAPGSLAACGSRHRQGCTSTLSWVSAGSEVSPGSPQLPARAARESALFLQEALLPQAWARGGRPTQDSRGVRPSRTAAPVTGRRERRLQPSPEVSVRRGWGRGPGGLPHPYPSLGMKQRLHWRRYPPDPRCHGEGGQ